jgi:hypothetical protein
MVTMAQEIAAAVEFSSLEELSDLVNRQQGVATVEMERLRDAYGVRRLGIHVRTAISNRLKGFGLGHFPQELPLYQWQLVRVYKLGSPVAELIQAVLEPSPGHDEKLRRAAGGDAEAILQKIRELVCE